MTPDDDAPGGPRPGQKTVFRPSPLAAREGADGVAPRPPAAAPPAAVPRALSALDDDVPPLAIPMRVRNPVMAAAARILALAAAVQAERQVSDPPALLKTASGEAKAFEKTLNELGLSAEDNARARYAVLATMDDIVQNLPGGAQSDWARNSLVVQSFGQAFGGDQMWTILDNMLARPAAYRDLLELYHACLAAGFQGRYRVQPNAQAAITERMNAIHATLADIRPRPEDDLVPQWRGRATPMRRIGWLVRFAIITAALFALLLLVFLALKFWLDAHDEAARLALRQLPPVAPATIDRAGVDVAVPASGQLARIKARLTNPCIQTSDDGASIRLVIASCPGLPPSMFDKGATDVAPAYVPVLNEAAAALKPEPGKIAIVAHTDSDPIGGALAASYPDNLALSAARAGRVAELLAGVTGDPARLTVEGRGDREPVDRGDSADAKARNRRVELILPRSE